MAYAFIVPIRPRKYKTSEINDLLKSYRSTLILAPFIMSMNSTLLYFIYISAEMINSNIYTHTFWAIIIIVSVAIAIDKFLHPVEPNPSYILTKQNDEYLDGSLAVAPRDRQKMYLLVALHVTFFIFITAIFIALMT
jgi:hypothetical protein